MTTRPSIQEIQAHYTLEKFETIAALIPGLPPARGVDNGIMIGDDIQIVFQSPSDLAREKGRCRLTIMVSDGVEWFKCPLREQMRITKSAQAIANDLQRRVISAALKSRDIHRDGRQRLNEELELSRRTLVNLQNVSPRSLSIKTYAAMLPRLSGEIDGASVAASTGHRRPDRVDLQLGNLTQFTAEQVLATIRQHQGNDNADNI
jgi:hypothetical protein